MTRYASIAALLLVPAFAAGQTVRGVVVGGATSSTLPGVLVMLIDSANNVVARSLTDAGGVYRLSAARSGSYRVRTLRIGFRPVTSATIRLAEGSEVTQSLQLASVPVQLDTVRVGRRYSCRAVRDSALLTYAILEQIRAALSAAQLTARTRGVDLTWVTYMRALERDERTVKEESSSLSSGFVTQPWRSFPVDSLRRYGYVRTDRANLTHYYAPGLDVLISDHFLQDHCFGLARSDERAQLGVRFEPMHERVLPEIKGTLWLDRTTSELRRMEYRYVNVSREQENYARGDIDFARMSNGGWTISRWSIRMPVVGRLYKTGVGMESVVEEVRVAGGELVLARRGSDTLWSRGSMTLSGTVRDSTSGAAVATARVALRGTRFEVVTDVAGRFAISGVLPGEYMVEVRTPSLDSVSAVHQAPLRFVEKDVAIRLRVPDARLIAASVCGRDSVATAHDGIVIGMVSYRGDTLPAARSTVAAEWDEFFTGGDSPRQRRRWLDGVTGAQGMFRLCGLPRDTKLTLRAATDSASAEPVELRIPPTTRFARADLVLDREQAAHAVFSGVVLVDSTRQPLPDVTISLSAISRSTATNEQGAFRLRDIPAGTHLVEARRLGYAPATMQLAFAPNQTVHQQILLGRVPVLDTVAVRARPVIASFEEHRTIGLGRFFTSDTLRKMESRRLSDILAPLPGTDIMKGIGNHAWLTLNRGVRSRMPKTMELDKGDLAFGAKPEKCYAQVYLDGSLVYRGREREPLFDLSSISVASIEAIEYYTGAAQTPLKYSGLDSQCGVLVIHTRRAP